MELAQFRFQMDRVKDSFKNFSTERRDLIWEKFNSVDASDFKRVVDDIIGNNNVVPTVQDFESRLKGVFSREEPKGCRLCDYSGRILVNQIEKCPVRNVDTTYRYAYRCKCDLGKTFQNYQPYQFEEAF